VTWKELKDWVEAQDVKDEDELRSIVWSAEHGGVVVTMRSMVEKVVRTLVDGKSQVQP
jgi:hypothetical protein